MDGSSCCAATELCCSMRTENLSKKVLSGSPAVGLKLNSAVSKVSSSCAEVRPKCRRMRSIKHDGDQFCNRARFKSERRVDAEKSDP